MYTIYRSLIIFFDIIQTLILVRVIFSWIRVGRDSLIGNFIYSMTDPVLYPAKLLLHKLGLDRGMFDFSPVVAILMMDVILRLVAKIIF